jgi:LPXTG-motif cell wall-anchored protein
MHTPNYMTDTHYGKISKGVVGHSAASHHFNPYLPAMEQEDYAGWWADRHIRRAGRKEKRAAKACAKNPNSKRCLRLTSKAAKAQAKAGNGSADMTTYDAGMGAPTGPSPVLIIAGLGSILGLTLFLTRKKK